MTRTPESHRAHSQVAYALQTGRLVKPAACEQCGEPSDKLEAAHHDYSLPLSVRFLCTSCHRADDAANPKGGTVASAQEPPKLLTTLRDRIVGFSRVPAQEIFGSDFNFRTHGAAQSRAVEESLAARGMYDAVITYRDASGALGIADGHLRQSLINAKVGPETLIPIIETDLTEEEAKAVLLVHDPLSAMAGVDKQKLDTLMRECDAAGPEVAKMLEKMAKQNQIDWSTVVGSNPGINSGLELAAAKGQTTTQVPVCPHCGGSLG